MNKLVLSLLVAVLAFTASVAGNHTIENISNETTATEIPAVTTVTTDFSAEAETEKHRSAVTEHEKSEKNIENTSAQAVTTTVKSKKSSKQISAKEAEEIALKKAGLKASEVYDKEVELDYEKGVYVYEVSFEKDRAEYDYIIDATSGKILHSKVTGEKKTVAETTKKTESTTKQTTTRAKNEEDSKKISAKEAEEIALKKAGFKASEVYDKEVELDYEKGSWVYEVSFEKGNKDYEYVINAVNGKILYSDVETDN